MTWIIEDTAFSGGDALLPALKKLNKDVILWNDDFWNDGQYKDFPNKSIFHGSLENASKLNKAKLPNIISLCNEEQFSYSYLFKNYSDYLLNQHPIFTTIAELMDNPSILNRISTEKFFARPDSPLKAFSGRLLGKTNLTPAHFDYGFYHSDMNLPIVLSEYNRDRKGMAFCLREQKNNYRL